MDCPHSLADAWRVRTPQVPSPVTGCIKGFWSENMAKRSRLGYVARDASAASVSDSHTHSGSDKGLVQTSKVSQRAWGLGPRRAGVRPRYDAARRVAFRFSLQRRRPGVSTFRGSATSCRPPGAQRMLDPGCFPCSSPLQIKLSPPFSGPPKSPAAAGIRASGLGVRYRNDTLSRSPNAAFSPNLGAWPIYSTSFFR
jgi:hypothetical protein